MKSITKFINESLTNKTINNLKVVYDVQPEVVVFQYPSTYSESDVQIYIGDRFLNALPSDEKYGKKMFGKNFENINDANFEYDKFEPTNEDVDITFEWDAQYDTSVKEPELIVAKITNMRYIILFDQFTYSVSDKGNDKEIIDSVFAASEYNDANQYPLEIKYNSEKTEYTK